MSEGDRLPYRRNVGAALFNRNGLVFVARRSDMPNAEGPAGGWQLPQGGIDPEEAPRTAVLRELAEEIGTDRAEIIGEHRGTRGALPRPEAALVRTAFHR